MRRLVLNLTLIVVLSLVGTMAGLAQVTTATIYGRVLDQTGGVLPGASVMAANQGTTAQRTVITDERGEFSMAFLGVGTYTITVAMDGFKTRAETGLTVGAGQSIRKDFSLEVAAVAETVTVSSEAAMLNQTNAQQDIRLTERDIRELPVASRDLTNVLSLGTGVSGGSSLSINGLPPQGFVFTVDGSFANPDPELPQIGMYQNFNVVKGLSIEAISEIQTSKNIFSAETANTVGGNVNVISKSGSNSFHGSLFYNYQAGGLNARNQFVSDQTPLVFNQFGGSAGGPIIRDKLFVFGAWESYRLTAKSVISGDVPTKELRDAASASMPSPAAEFFAGYPLPNDPSATGDLAFFSGSGSETREDDHFVIRTDYNHSDTNLFNVRFTFFDPSRVTPYVHTRNFRSWIGDQRALAGAWTNAHADWTSELRIGWNWTQFDRVDNFFTENIVAAYLDGVQEPQSRLFGKDGNTLTFEEVVAMPRGRHQLKFGAIYQYQTANRVSNGAVRYFYDSREALLTNAPDSAFYRFGKTPKDIKTWQLGGFIQDDIRWTPRLVVNLGLRYDYYSVMRAEDDAVFNRVGPYDQAIRPPDSPWNNDLLNFSPRISFAYTLDDSSKTVLKAGYGVFTSRFNTFSGPVEVQKDDQNPFSSTFSRNELADLGCRYPNEAFEPCDSGISPREFTADPTFSGGSVMDADTRNPYSQQWSMGVQRQMVTDLVLDVSYVGTHGVKLQYSPDYNQVNRLTGDRPFPRISQFRYYMGADSSVYHSLQASLKKRFSRDLSFNLNYTWISSMAYFRGQMTCCGGGENPQDIFPITPGDPNSLTSDSQGQNRHFNDFLSPHRFTADWIWQVPTGDFDSKAADLLLRGWQLGGVFKASSGDTINIAQGGTALQGARPDWGSCGSHADAIVNVGNTYLDKACFINVEKTAGGAAARPGTLSRRALFDPGWWDLDLAISKRFFITERVRLQVRGDMFNAFNHTNLRNVNGTSTSGSFGLLRSSRGARIVQLNARLEW